MSLLALLRRASVILVTLSVAVSAARAQRPVRVTGSTNVVPVSISERGPATPDSSTATETRLRAVIATGAPRSYQVVSIPIPDALVGASNLQVEVVPRGDFAVLGPRKRFLD